MVIAFFPCIYFCAFSQMAFSFTMYNYRKKTMKEKTDLILERSANREHFFRLMVKMFSVALDKGIRMIVENPWSQQTFLKGNFVMPPSLIDNDRTLRGDYFKKPTAYWFLNCEHTFGKSIQKDKERKTIMKAKKSPQAGICSEERSMISPDYARNFICDFILGKKQEHTERTLFDF